MRVLLGGAEHIPLPHGSPSVLGATVPPTQPLAVGSPAPLFRPCGVDIHVEPVDAVVQVVSVMTRGRLEHVPIGAMLMVQRFDRRLSGGTQFIMGPVGLNEGLGLVLRNYDTRVVTVSAWFYDADDFPPPGPVPSPVYPTRNKPIVRYKTPGALDSASRWDRTLEIGMRDMVTTAAPVLGEECAIMRFRRDTRLFRKRDLCIMVWWNGGGERQPVYGRSSRGYNVHRYYVQYARYLDTLGHAVQPWSASSIWDGPPTPLLRRDDRCPVVEVAYPRDLHKRRVDDAGVRRFVVERLCAAHPAGRVGAGSSAPFMRES